MELQEWISGSFQETDIDYKIAGQNILYKNEESYLVKGVELLCDKLNPSSVLEFGFGKGWTATEFQRKGVTRHVILEPNIQNYQMALTWKANYSTNIDILNIFSWDYSGGETFDLIYDDREPFSNVADEDNHFTHMKTLFSSTQWYGMNVTPASGDVYNYAIDFTLNGVNYRQHLTRGFYGNS